MSTIVIKSSPSSLVKPEELNDYIRDIESSVGGIKVTTDEQDKSLPGMMGVTWWEIIRIYIQDIPAEVQGYVIGKILDASVKWAKRRFKKSPLRPKAFIVLDENKSEAGTLILQSRRHKPRAIEEYKRLEEKRNQTKRKKKKSKAKGDSKAKAKKNR